MKENSDDERCKIHGVATAQRNNCKDSQPLIDDVNRNIYRMSGKKSSSDGKTPLYISESK